MREWKMKVKWLIISLIMGFLSFSFTLRANSISTNMLRPFLNDSLAVNRSELARAPAILAMDDQHILGGRCFRCFAAVCNPQVGDYYGIYRCGKNFIDPRDGRFLGKEAIFLGVARLVEAASCSYKTSTFVLESGLKEIRKGDNLLPYLPHPHEACIPLRMPDTKGCGIIIDVLGGLRQVGQYTMVAITGGRDCCRQQGDVLNIYQTKYNESTRLQKCREFQIRRSCNPPRELCIIPQKAGEMMVYSVFDKVSFALVTNSYRPIYLQDMVKRP